MLAFADDMVLVAGDIKELQSMINCLVRYLERNKLVLNVEKSKIQIFSKGGRRAASERWTWKGENIGTVKRFMYLGYVMSSSGGDGEQVEQVSKKAMQGIGRLWGIAERKFPTGMDLR